MTGQPPGVIGIGQTKYSKARTDVSIPGLVREAASRALDDAGLDWGDIDALVMGKAPDISACQSSQGLAHSAEVSDSGEHSTAASTLWKSSQRSKLLPPSVEMPIPELAEPRPA